MFSKSKRTHEGLTILACFEPVCERQHLRSILRDAYVNLFLSKRDSPLLPTIDLPLDEDFENDLMEVRATFEAHKDDPPLPRNAPPVPGKCPKERERDDLRLHGCFRSDRLVSNSVDED